MEEFRTPLSRAEAILENILGAENELQDPLSNVEEILLSILNDTPYEKEPETLIEEMLLAIKEGTEMDAIAKNRVEEILLAIIHGEEYTKLPLSRFEELLIEWLKESAVTEKFLDFAPILTFSDSAGKPLVEGKVKIEPVQDLHGYDNPWPAGGGKNLFDITKATNNSRGPYGLQITFDGDYIKITGASVSTGTGAFAVVANYADDSLSGKGYVLQAFDVTGGTINSIYGFRTTTERQVAIAINREEGVEVNMSFRLSVAASSQNAWTPYENICPISGHTEVSVVKCGKNLTSVTELSDIRSFWGTNWLDQVTELNKLPVGTYTITVNFETKSITSGSNPTVGAPYIRALVNGGYVNLTTYSVIQDSSPSVGKIYTKTVTFTITEQTKGKITQCYLYCGGGGAGIGTYKLYNVQIENSSSATAYEPYQGETYTITLGDTIYGGVLDVTTGELTVDRAKIIYDGSENGWNAYTGYEGYYISNPSMKSGTRQDGISNMLKNQKNSTIGQKIQCGWVLIARIYLSLAFMKLWEARLLILEATLQKTILKLYSLSPPPSPSNLLLPKSQPSSAITPSTLTPVIFQLSI